MQHPPLTGHGDPGNFASRNPEDNIEYPAVEAANGQLPALFNGMTMEATGLRVYDSTGVGYSVASPALGLDKTDSNAAPMAFEGNFTGGGFVKPSYLLGPAYRALLSALESGDVNQLKQWYDAHFQGSESNWNNFLNTLGLAQAVQQAESTVLTAAAKRLPAI